jgi:hypothetical protein
MSFMHADAAILSQLVQADLLLHWLRMTAYPCLCLSAAALWDLVALPAPAGLCWWPAQTTACSITAAHAPWGSGARIAQDAPSVSAATAGRVQHRGGSSSGKSNLQCGWAARLGCC